MSDEAGKNIVMAGQVKFWFDEQRKIIMCSTVEGAELTIEDARACTEVMKNLTGGVPRPFFGDFSKMKSQTKECRDYYAQNPQHLQTYSAVALLVKGAFSRVLANFFLGLNKPPKPTQLFNDQAKAIAWLETQGSQSP